MHPGPAQTINPTTSFLPLWTARPRTHREPAHLIPHLGRKHQVRLERLLLRRKRLVPVHPHLQVLVRAGIFQRGVPFSRRALLEHDGKTSSSEAGDAGDLLEASGF